MAKQLGTGERRWYAIHTYSGYENAVARNLKQRIDSLNMSDKIFSVVVPTEKKIRVKGGKRVTEEERIYPGYVLVEMIVDDESWFVVRNTPRVTGFVGSATTGTGGTAAKAGAEGGKGRNGGRTGMGMGKAVDQAASGRPACDGEPAASRRARAPPMIFTPRG